MEIVQSAAGNIDDDWEKFEQSTLGAQTRLGACFGQALIDQMERAGFTPMVAAEIHYNIHLQLALIQSGYGVGLLASPLYCQGKIVETRLKCCAPPSFDLRLVRGDNADWTNWAPWRGPSNCWKHGIRHLFEAANTNEAR